MSLKDIYSELPEPYRSEMLRRIGNKWEFTARPDQIIPSTGKVHALISGRGAGKTRASMEWVRELAKTPNLRLLLVARTAGDVRDTLVEGLSGILSISDPSEMPKYQPSIRRLTWANGTMAFCTSADEPDSIRGVQAHYAVGDEATVWPTPQNKALTAFDNMLIATRLGPNPQILLNGTPDQPSQVTEWLQDAVESGDPDVRVVHASTYDNSALPSSFVSRLNTLYAGSSVEATAIYGQFPPR